MSDWKTMDSAPRDGTIVELTWMDKGRPQEIYPMQWGHIQKNGLFAPGVTGMWVMPNGAATWTEHDPDGAPTHWRPLLSQGTTTMSESIETLIQMARAAERDDRLSDGALYGKLARALALQSAALDKCAIIIKNRDQNEYEAKILGYIKSILRAEIDWLDEPAFALQEQQP
jgi:hypothetical protein